MILPSVVIVELQTPIMNKEQIRGKLLPVGLLAFGAGYLATYVEPSAVDIEDFLRGLGLAFILSALFFKARVLRRSS